VIGFLNKPFTSDLLIKTVRDYMPKSPDEPDAADAEQSADETTSAAAESAETQQTAPVDPEESQAAGSPGRGARRHAAHRPRERTSRTAAMIRNTFRGLGAALALILAACGPRGEPAPPHALEAPRGTRAASNDGGGAAARRAVPRREEPLPPGAPVETEPERFVLESRSHVERPARRRALREALGRQALALGATSQATPVPSR